MHLMSKNVLLSGWSLASYRALWRVTPFGVTYTNNFAYYSSNDFLEMQVIFFLFLHHGVLTSISSWKPALYMYVSGCHKKTAEGVGFYYRYKSLGIRFTMLPTQKTCIIHTCIWFMETVMIIKASWCCEGFKNYYWLPVYPILNQTSQNRDSIAQHM